MVTVGRNSLIADRGCEPMVLYPQIKVTDRRGQAILVPDMDHPVNLMVNVSTDRQSDAELVGQVSNRLLKVICRSAPVASWARVKFRGEYWDLAIPPVISRFTKATTHVEFVIRSRNEAAA